jgi:hypothetical protein
MNVRSFKCCRNEGGVSEITFSTFILVWVELEELKVYISERMGY